MTLAMLTWRRVEDSGTATVSEAIVTRRETKKKKKKLRKKKETKKKRLSV